ARRDRSDVPLVLLGGPGDHHGPRRQARQQQHESSRVRVLRDLLDGDRQAEDPGATAAVLLGDAQAGEAGVDEEREQVVWVLLALVDLAGTGRNTFLRQLSDGGLELGELVGELVIHDRRCYRSVYRSFR